MQELIAELKRLYLLDGQQYHAPDPNAQRSGPAHPLSPAVLTQHLSGERSIAVELVNAAGWTRALVMEFGGKDKGDGERHWDALCAIANALQQHLDLPAPAVSVSGRGSYQLWLSLAAPVPVVQAQQFLQLLRAVYLPPAPPAVVDPYLSVAQLPPCRQATGKWAAFIHPGMGASFADDPALEVAPPLAAQQAFLAGLRSISMGQFEQALGMLRQQSGTATATVEAVVAPVMPDSAVSAGLLLKDATLEDIVQFLHARNIEPTFRHLLR
ncbi:hypothetical protein [Janthinobacterium agaricidamnosum]|uniref:Uncharacterized domain protein n=1 Tax=Janthinobacterium agaricidamnosum NBRC 102515 = DSM 9628 TaxID=1349767 RepID=W0V715_9BURK|nr:hypothetical protein [Janthinobacterium agaricidamnosum]CDG83395.1 putative uncharacterized domain protein [Janthinobacterium agaricidamnosum NBRC 102515 = DSM 9628]